MTVTPEQWAAAAADQDVTVDEMWAQIATTNARAPREIDDTFDRDLDPLGFGEWAFLFGSSSYKFIAEQILPNRIWVATIWTGLNGLMTDPPLVMSTGVFHLTDPDAEHLPAPLHEEMHLTEQEALDAHVDLVKAWARQ